MKKILSLIMVISMGLLFCFSPVFSAAGEKDQSAENPSATGGVVLFPYDNLQQGQTFTPTKNSLTRISIYLRDKVNGAGIRLALRKESDKTPVGGEYHFKRIEGSGTGWEDWSFDGSPLTVEPGESYGIYVGMLSSSTTYWVASLDSYGSGVKRQYSPVTDTYYTFSGDSTFIVEGNLVTTPAPETPPASDPTESTEEEATEQTKTDAKEAEVDESIEAPVLTGVLLNQEEVELTDEKKVTIEEKDELILNGTAPKGSVVVIFVGEESYEVPVDDAGNWTFKVDNEALSAGDNVIKVQTQVDEKGSEIVDLLTVNMRVAAVTVGETAVTPWYLTWGIYHTIGLVLLLILLALLVIYLVILRKKNKGTLKSKEVFGKKEKEEQ
ncbi:MAG: hypothetical protein PHW75_00825 [Patescibacteria group bacterium]|nr:hypothetical protein [Patescibacteria group bacterium]